MKIEIEIEDKHQVLLDMLVSYQPGVNTREDAVKLVLDSYIKSLCTPPKPSKTIKTLDISKIAGLKPGRAPSINAVRDRVESSLRDVAAKGGGFTGTRGSGPGGFGGGL